MLDFFRINDPYRLLVIFILLLLVRLPAFFDPIFTIPELGYMLVGEKMVDGSLLYAEIWDNVAPLSAMIYAGLDYLFDRSQLSYQLMAYLILCFQVLIFNSFLIKAKVFSQNTMIPGLIYGLLATLCYDMVTLSPFLVGLTFILLSLKNLFSHIEIRAKRDETIFNIGLYVGLATICYISFSIFILGVIAAFILFTGTTIRRYMLMLFGFFLPFILVSSYFYITNRLDDFFYNFFSPFTVADRVWYISFKDTLKLFVGPLAFFILALFAVPTGARLNNYQSRLTRVIFIWMIFSILFILLADQVSPSIFLVAAPPVAFYITHYFLMKKRGINTELSFLLFSGLCLATYFYSSSDAEWFKAYYNDSSYLIKYEDYQALQGKKVLVLADDLRPYTYASSATPFINWQLSESLFLHLNYYDNLAIIYDGINNDLPDVIIDPDKLMIGVFDKIPALKKKYTVGSKGYYYAKFNN